MKHNRNISISIIIPYYNSDAYIGDILEDLLHQDISTDEYEIIVVDDGSIENIDILRSYCVKYSCIRYILIKHAGPSTARNIGLGAAKGEYVFFCDSVYRVKRNVFGQLYKVAVNNNLEVLFFNDLTLQDKESQPDSGSSNELDSPIISGDAYFSHHPEMSMGLLCCIIKRNFLVDNNLHYPKDVIIVEEQMFIISILLLAKCVSHIDSDIFYYNQRADSLVHEAYEIHQPQKAADCRLRYIQYLIKVMNDQDILCVESIKKERDFTTFITMHNAFRYLSISQNRHILRVLQDMGAYPFGKQRLTDRFHRFIQWAMNNSVLWITCCVLIHVLPGSLREKL